MNRKRSSQYTLRGIPASLDHILRDRARRLGRSLNKVAIDALTQGAGQGQAPMLYHDLDGFIGSWIADSEVDRALAEQRTIDRTAWQ